ncbi:unnamed protein product [Candidula unifasciata]|uniref:Tyrosine-protein phosphatase non-receptor type 9 n=1 Tax=Candidula unifasciata TaxID=100452 RepID=A0A8S3ZSF7_9EUPU|nr:unnamed protein product [Candidula unifasciata]
MSGEDVKTYSANSKNKEMQRMNRKRKTSDSAFEDDSTQMPKRKLSVASGSNERESYLHSSDNNGVTVQMLLDKVTTVKMKGLFSEYAAIRTEAPVGTFETSKLKANVAKNRYSDVLCYDHSIVAIPHQSSSYINANFVDGYKQKNAFICTQGPLPNTFVDFWRMVWYNQTCVIVMTTRTVERSRIKCGQYWPGDKYTSRKFEELVVSNEDIIQHTDFIETQLTLRNSRTGESHPVIHLQFIGWPDHGVPQAPPFLTFLARVRHVQKALTKKMGSSWSGHPLGPPVVVHCSAGIGRTGTFIAVDICLRQLEDVGVVNIQDTVRKIRSQRAFAVQVPEQYAFCYLAVIEYAQNSGLISSKKHISFADIQ